MLQQLVPMLTALMRIKEYGTRVHTQENAMAVCAIATNNQLLTELKKYIYFFSKKTVEKKESDFKAYNNQTSNDEDATDTQEDVSNTQLDTF